MSNPRVAIIILNWNRWKDTVECLESVYQNNYSSFEVILVDNGSIDNSLDNIKQYCKGNLTAESKYVTYLPDNKPIEYIDFERQKLGIMEYKIQLTVKGNPGRLFVIKNECNLGYAEGVNTGIKFAVGSLNADYLLLLNNDIVVDSEFLIELLSLAETDIRYGFVGPKIYYYDYHGRDDVINFAGGRVNLWLGLPWHLGADKIDNGKFDEEKNVDYIEGSCLLVKKDMIDEIGLLNPEYFAYWEEADWCFRARKNGWQVMYEPKAKIWHRVSASSGGKLNPLPVYYMTRNNFIFMKLNASSVQKFTFLCFFICVIIPMRIIHYLVLKQNIGAVKAFINGVRDGISYFAQDGKATS